MSKDDYAQGASDYRRGFDYDPSKPKEWRDGWKDARDVDDGEGDDFR